MGKTFLALEKPEKALGKTRAKNDKKPLLPLIFYMNLSILATWRLSASFSQDISSARTILRRVKTA